jgi:hypothetical protein
MRSDGARTSVRCGPRHWKQPPDWITSEDREVLPLPPFIPIAFKQKGVGLCGHGFRGRLQFFVARAIETIEAGSVLYVQHKYNSAVADNFARDEFFGADRKLDMKAKIKVSVKEVQKLSANAKKAVGATGGPSFGAGATRPRPPRRNRGGGASGGDRSLPHGFAKPGANAPGEQLGNKKGEIVCFKCQEKGHFARDCPNK